MRAALRRRNVVYERKYALGITVGMLKSEFDKYSVFLGFTVNRLVVEFGFTFVEIQNVIDYAAVVFERL